MVFIGRHCWGRNSDGQAGGRDDSEGGSARARSKSHGILLTSGVPQSAAELAALMLRKRSRQRFVRRNHAVVIRFFAADVRTSKRLLGCVPSPLHQSLS